MTLKQLFDIADKAKESDDCYELSYMLNAKGYPRLHLNGKMVKASRLILGRKLGKSLQDLDCACHSCDNSKCINERHLWEGTRGDNSRDAHRKGRSNPWGRR